MDESSDGKWVSMDEIEAEVSRTPDTYRRAMLNRPESVSDEMPRRGPVEGRVLRPGERLPGAAVPTPPPEPKSRTRLMEYVGPVTGRVLGADVFQAFVLDGPAAGQWKVERNHWRAIEMVDGPTYRFGNMGGAPYLDESVHTKTTMYSLHKLGLMVPNNRRLYGFWSSLPPGQMEPIDALYLLIDAEPWQSRACRIE